VGRVSDFIRSGAQQKPLVGSLVKPVELYFVCPLTGKSYWTPDWEIAGELKVEENPQGTRRLKGKVSVTCPHCESRHVYATEELVCPLTQT